MPHLPFGSVTEMEVVDVRIEITGTGGSPEGKLGRRASLLNTLRSKLRRHHDVIDTGREREELEIEEPVVEEAEIVDGGLAEEDSTPGAVDLTVSEAEAAPAARLSDRLCLPPPIRGPSACRPLSLTRRSCTGIAQRRLSPPPTSNPSASAPAIHARKHSHSNHVSSERLPSLDHLQHSQQGNFPNHVGEQDFDAFHGGTWLDNDSITDEANEEAAQAAVRSAFDRSWILNLSMSFRDKSKREKYFVTYAESPIKWRRVTISLDYNDPVEGSLEEDLTSMRYQRDKSFRIFEAIHESLEDIAFYDTVTNLKLQTTRDDGQLHVHVSEDANEIIQYPATSLFGHVSCPHYRESELDFESHLSGFVYKVHAHGKLLVKKEIAGPDTVDEFMYEVNALDALSDSEHVVKLEGLVTDELGSSVRGLLISYASRGALVDIIYDYAGTLEWTRREKWTSQIIAGLSDIHEAGFIQGDFTLSNIVIDDHDNALIIDINRRGCPVGWEPPELGRLIDSGQRIGMHISVKTDLYQLGMVLWGLAEENDVPDKARPLRPLGSNIPGWYCQIVDTCLETRPQARASAARLLLLIPDDAGRSSRDMADPLRTLDPGRHGTTLDDLKASDSSNSTMHRSDKEYIDPDLTVTLDEVHRHTRGGYVDSASYTEDQVTYVDPMEISSPTGNISYHFASSGSWIVGHSRGRSPISSRRRRSSPCGCGETATSATSLSLSPGCPSRRSGKVYLAIDDDQSTPEGRILELPDARVDSVTPISTATVPHKEHAENADSCTTSTRDLNERSLYGPPLHQDSGFDEEMLQDMHLNEPDGSTFEVGTSACASWPDTANSTPRASVNVRDTAHLSEATSLNKSDSPPRSGKNGVSTNASEEIEVQS
ncbi:hypothetical protein B0A48_09336 [Cryoendolithus antarcticus]|uniref:Protein kinase domain-containing protein n=1 Tax=Cryoendolithus antarcticus TaxID=1507870 RepID=A0A1V8T2C3_9PEZI|nr:hypothetical protein B0A48_09336 [Cryoendolithus antarcticus]